MQFRQAPSTSSEAEASSTHHAVDSDSLDSLRLANQLSAEASHLAMVYPPNPAVLEECDGVWAAPRSRRRWWWSRAGRAWWISTCVGVLLAVGVGTHLVLSPSVPSSQRARTPPVNHAPSAAANRAESAADPSTVISPVMLVSELSDPELEAWLDLHRDKAPERIAF
ncbi:MAG: hypothetical protein R6U98_18130 [Pirellulaceae bacterium]